MRPVQTEFESGDRALLKGVEEEVYTGSPAGRVVGFAHRVTAELEGFSMEPDSRNVEFVTRPGRCVGAVVDEVMAKRRELRGFLRTFGDFTLIPGATIPLDTGDDFWMSDESDPYFRFIRREYGTRVVTASTQINIGLEDGAELLRVYRVLRCEAAAYLALTAASPFYRGRTTGFHSTRWNIFPRTPDVVPLFADPAAYAVWMDRQLASGAMFNPRHLWLSVRPNGPRPPRRLSRVEVRICDRIDDPRVLGALLAWIEMRVRVILDDPALDPLRTSGVDPRSLLSVVDANEREASHRSLDGIAMDWRSGRSAPMSAWIGRLLAEMPNQEPLRPIAEQLRRGNPAQRWLRRSERGESIEQIIMSEIARESERDQSYEPST